MSHALIKLSAYRVWLFSQRGKLKVRQHRKGLFWPLTGRNYYKKSRSHGICPMAHWHGMCTLIEFFGCPAPSEHPSNIRGCPTAPRRSQNHPLTAGMRPVKKSWQHTHWWELLAWLRGVKARVLLDFALGGWPRVSGGLWARKLATQPLLWILCSF